MAQVGFIFLSQWYYTLCGIQRWANGLSTLQSMQYCEDAHWSERKMQNCVLQLIIVSFINKQISETQRVNFLFIKNSWQTLYKSKPLKMLKWLSGKNGGVNHLLTFRSSIHPHSKPVFRSDSIMESLYASVD